MKNSKKPYVMNGLMNWHSKDTADKIWFVGEFTTKASNRQLKTW